MTTVEVRRELARQQLSYELIPHARTATAEEEAAAVGLPPSQVAKTLVLATDEGYVRAVLPASEKLDLARLRETIGRRRVRLATEAELAERYPMFELGAVPPVGGPDGDRVIVDTRLARLESAVFDAGSHNESVRMRTDDLLILAAAETADICRGTAADR